MKKLHLVNLEATDNIITPEQFEEINLASPAVEIFTDFKVHKALMIDGDTMAVTALQLMLKTHVRMNIVVAENDNFIGIISTNELSEQHIVAKLAKGIAREDILVKDLMIPKSDFHAFDYSELLRASVGDVVSTLENYQLRHCLVLDRESHHIRGVISTSDIARKLHMNMDLNVQQSFGSVYDVVHQKASSM
ncbi:MULTISPECIES: CBS domain-containing protein [unclassified Colwellia]|jgi:CBS domain containing-hemolysin-like protein|uniref:CBS domain-containing protein n=1 Tax=unclassified Colwellia TaxID=196834 RepID=UPI000D333630|nr:MULTISPECIES: CBS domain-containing protein [unclassified Colwellia]AWB57936.1 histidine kinase [Colwellia sp. Arc7-D]MBA6415201.1 CBS domain-containing protein [Colwellia sp. 6M3]|tara:strand:- start:778 stop:1353 length:576 start_codon:yes stop_codon:yes gene_type:complete